MATDYSSIDEYIATFSEPVQQVLQRVRETIAVQLPDATEAISYQIPTFRIEGKNVIHFAGWKKHISIYPVPQGDAVFQAEIAPFVSGKGTVKFPLDDPLPMDLISRIARLLGDAGTQAR